MPFVQIKLVEGVISDEKKRQMLERVTEAMVSVEGESLRPLTMVTIEEVKSGDWAIGGKTFTKEEVKAIAEQKASEAA